MKLIISFYIKTDLVLTCYTIVTSNVFGAYVIPILKIYFLNL